MMVESWKVHKGLEKIDNCFKNKGVLGQVWAHYGPRTICLLRFFIRPPNLKKLCLEEVINKITVFHPFFKLS